MKQVTQEYLTSVKEVLRKKIDELDSEKEEHQVMLVLLMMMSSVIANIEEYEDVEL